ncbi:hypothetical protein [Rhodoplanes serenus]|uniref:hypothetical protein n=1 Tax=Rhodoplanes serenus TaxID=200615 RepID=UPI001FE1925D|nr:hypothetical protein [Rhodoplanes serenus]
MAGRTRLLGLMAITAAGLAVAPGEPARAQDNGPVIVIPGRRDVPVFINGREASYAVVEGDWGLYRPGWMGPTVIKPLWLRPGPGYRRNYRWGYRPEHFYPTSAEKPRLGRLEYDPAARLPPRPAEPFHESWHAESQPLPATIMPPDYSYDMPGVVVAPGGRGRW